MPITPHYGEVWPGPCYGYMDYLATQLNTITVSASVSLEDTWKNGSGTVILHSISTGSGTSTWVRGNLSTYYTFRLQQYGCCSVCDYSFGASDNETASGTSTTTIDVDSNFPSSSLPIVNTGPYTVWGLSMGFRTNPTTHVCEFNLSAYQSIGLIFGFNDAGYGLTTDWIPVSNMLGNHTATFTLSGDPNENSYETLNESLTFTFNLS